MSRDESDKRDKRDERDEEDAMTDFLERQRKSTSFSHQEAKEEIETLLRHPGWKRFKEYLEERIITLREGVLKRPISSHDEVFSQEYAKGELNAFVEVDGWAHDQLNTADLYLKNTPEDDDSEEENYG